MNDEFTPKISVITATKNVEGTIARLSNSLTVQSYRNFEWIVVDGSSTDSTVRFLSDFSRTVSWLRFVSEPDFGLYHALNKAIVMARGEFYVVAGADDIFTEDALARYGSKVEECNPDVILSRVVRATKIVGGFHPSRKWIGPAKVFAGSHSLGMLIRKDLHNRFGFYSKRFPLLADSYFLKRLLISNSIKFEEADFVAGTFVDGGLTTTSKLQILAETWQIQMMTEPFPLLQTLLFCGKIAVRWPALLHELATQRSRRR